MTKLIVFFAVMALASAGKVRRETPNNIDEIPKEAQANIPNTAEDKKQANSLKEKLQTAVTNTVAETQKLVKEVSANIEQTNTKLAPQIKQAYEDFIKQAEEVQKAA